MNQVPHDYPFYITASLIGSGELAFDDGVTGQIAAGNDVLRFDVPMDAPQLLYYQCAIHSHMGNLIDITDVPVSEPVILSDTGNVLLL